MWSNCSQTATQILIQEVHVCHHHHRHCGLTPVIVRQRAHEQVQWDTCTTQPSRVQHCIAMFYDEHRVPLDLPLRRVAVGLAATTTTTTTTMTTRWLTRCPRSTQTHRETHRQTLTHTHRQTLCTRNSHAIGAALYHFHISKLKFKWFSFQF